jgi:hypothetical protein
MPGPLAGLCSLAVNPRIHVAFSPPKVLADPVCRQPPLPPFVADGALEDSKYRGHVACRQHAVGASECVGATLYACPIVRPVGRVRAFTCRRARGAERDERQGEKRPRANPPDRSAGEFFGSDIAGDSRMGRRASRGRKRKSSVTGPKALDSWQRAKEAFSIADTDEDRIWTRFLDQDRFDTLCVATYLRIGKPDEARQVAEHILARLDQPDGEASRSNPREYSQRPSRPWLCR